jgi:uncharacterized protein YkwD
MADDVTVDGRALARNGNVTLINDTITRTTCAATTAPTATPTTATTATTAAGSSPVVPFLPNAATLDGVPVTTGSLVAVFGIIAVLSTLMVVAVKRSGARR